MSKLPIPKKYPSPNNINNKNISYPKTATLEKENARTTKLINEILLGRQTSNRANRLFWI